METTTAPSKATVAAPVYECLPRIDESFDQWLDRLSKREAPVNVSNDLDRS